MAKDPSRTVSIHGDKYTYDKDKDKWMSGKKEATPATSAMLDMILEELGPEGDEEVESFVGTADIVPQSEDKETPEEQQAKEDAHERKEEAQDDMEAPPSEQVAEIVKPAPIENVVALSPRVETEEEAIVQAEVQQARAAETAQAQPELIKPAPPEGVVLPQPQVPAGEQTVSQTPVAQQPKTRSQKIKQDFDRNFAKQLSSKAPGITVLTNNKTEGKDASGVDAMRDAMANIKEMFADSKNWFKKKEVFEKRESLDKLTDLTPQEIKRLEEKGIAPSSENDFSYRKEGKPLSKEDLVQELNQDSDERNAKPEPFYKKKAAQLGKDYNKAFKSRLKEKLPMLSLFTDKLDETDDAEQVPTGNASGVGDKEAVSTLKSIDVSIKQIIGIIRGEDTKTEEQKAENSQSDAVKELEKKELGSAESEDKEGFAYNLGRKTKKGINSVKDTFGKVKEKMGFGEKAAEGAEAEAVAAPAAAEGASGLAGAAEGVAGAAESASGLAGAAEGAVGLAEGAAGLAAAPELLAGLGAAAVVGGLGYGAYKLFGGGDDAAPAAESEKPAITDQTKVLSQAEDQRKSQAAQSNKAQTPGATIINNTSMNTNNNGGGGGGYSPTAGARNSLDLLYFA